MNTTTSAATDPPNPPNPQIQELSHVLKALELSLYWNRGSDAAVYDQGTDLRGYVQRLCKDQATLFLLRKYPADYRLIREIGGVS